MGLQSSIDIKLINNFGLIQFIESLSLHQWSLIHDDSILYLPKNDIDFNWNSVKKEDYDLVLNTIKIKLTKKETIGVSMYHLDIKSGFLFHYFPQTNKIMILLTYNRIKISNTKFTDFTIYLKEIYKIISQDEIEYIVCQDTY
ncbi:hypothetical protein [Emticicia sp. SJ17W-69]|uniref:hypothetical protein n=1 Tax=Emticicia sp. SJ17W-69 TaxID=3421657 RepID=UPI003EBD70A7